MWIGKVCTLIIAVTFGVSIMTIVEGGRNSMASGPISEKRPLESRVETGAPFETVRVMNRISLMERISMYWKFFFDKGEKVPSVSLPQQKVNLAELFTRDSDAVKAAWLGHSSLLINIDGYSVLTDPVFERKVSPIGPTRFNKDLPLDIGDLPAVDAVIISHDHYDHLNKFSIKKLLHKVGVFIVPIRVGELLRKWGVPESKIVELSWWQEYSPLGDLTIAATPARHFSGRALFDRNRRHWASWVIQTSRHKVFFSGDTGYFSGFREIGTKYGPFDIVFMECGAYNKHWSNIHMFPEQTVQAFADLGGKTLQPIHWATFNLSLHAWYEPMERFLEAAWASNVQVSIPVMGQVVDYEHLGAAELWWLPAKDGREGAPSTIPGLAAVQK